MRGQVTHAPNALSTAWHHCHASANPSTSGSLAEDDAETDVRAVQVHDISKGVAQCEPHGFAALSATLDVILWVAAVVVMLQTLRTLCNRDAPNCAPQSTAWPEHLVRAEILAS